MTAATAMATAAALTASTAPASAAALPVTASTTSAVTGAEQLRADQCVMGTVLRIGGPAEKAVAAQALDGSPAQLRAVASDATGSALQKAWDGDFQGANAISHRLQGRTQVWQQSVPMSLPPGFTQAQWGFAPNFFDTVGLNAWVANDYSPDQAGLTAPVIPVADKAAQGAVVALGNARYTSGAGSMAEQSAWRVLTSDLADYPLAADDARMLLEDGGFPATAPAAGSVDFRVAVEDLKARFASCDWRNPGDPNSVLGPVVDTAATEWQHEVSSQQAQRDSILASSQSATAALAKASEDLGELLGRSWQAGRLATWQQYWTGPGKVGVAPITFHDTASPGRCLDDPAASHTPGTRLWLWTCNSTAGQSWTYDQTTQALTDQAAHLCMDMDGTHGTPKPGTAVQLGNCNKSASQRWDLTVGGTEVKNLGTGLCLDLPTPDVKQYAQVAACNAGASQRFTAVQDDSGTGATGVNSPSYPSKATFTSVAAGLSGAQAEAKARLADLAQQLTTAQTDAAQVQSAQQQAYVIADQQGAPRGRGLLAALQEAQVTAASAAALDAVHKAGTTAYQATVAAADQGQTLQALALTQAHESKAAFDAAAAAAADQQAKDAAAGAAGQAKAAAAAEADAKTQLATAQAGEATAQQAAQRAQADQQTAATQLANAASDMQQAQTDQAQAATDASTAQADAATATAKQQDAQQAETAANTAKQAAQAQDSAARAARQQAWAAEQQQNALQAKAQAADAYADAESSNSDAADARNAANQADQDAADATTAATSAQTAANDATSKAAAADAAATRAQAAADAAGAAAKDAAAQKAAADQAVAMDNQAAAKAISDSQNAAAAAATAQQDAATAKTQAAKAHADATASRTQAAQAQTTASTAAGYAYATAQAATAASDAALQVAAPANDAVQLGAPYQDTDSAAGLAVLTAQASKTVAEQQAATAAARANAAQQAAQQAQASAATASADAKAAATSAADATTQAAAATVSAAQAVASADRARQYADQTQAADAAAQQYDDQAAAAQATAQADADQAQGDATAAKAAATAADSDAAAAQQAATAAAAAATAARQDAAQADQDAAAAAAAAKDAENQAAQAQAAATTAEEQQDTTAIDDGGATGIPHVFAMARITPGTATATGDCKPIWLSNGLCTQTYTITYQVTVDFFYCADLNAPATASGCPASDTFLLDTAPPSTQTTSFDHIQDQFGDAENLILQAMWDDFKGDVTKCLAGNGLHCVLAASAFVPANKILESVRVAAAVRDAIQASAGLEDALAAVREALAAKNINGAVAAGLNADIAQRAAELARFDRSVDPKLVDKLQKLGITFSRKDLLWVTSMPGGQLAFLETGNINAGLIHVVARHGVEFADNGITLREVPDLIRQALTDGKVIGYQGNDMGRPIYEILYKGVERHVAITVGDNGFVVGANLA
ncbi:RICIN domain-containing protein [Streptacidiphilus rugosus]|uniref:RICIN domain-containing protein n=1 Tax=Streptacidiphilus rugosus TaxID=405783 RepID=UPI000A01030B|nr:RICIN domain-containing protein [Streptacidiphilus rugosus]